MNDEEFRANVLRHLETIEGQIEMIKADSASDLEHPDRRLDAVVSRLEEQDTAYDRLIEKVDRLSVAVRQSLEASEQALTAVTNLGRRVARL